MQHQFVRIGGLIPLCLVATLVLAQTPPSAGPRPGRVERPAALRPGLLFAENWKWPAGTSGEVPLTREANGNPELDLEMFAPGGVIEINKASPMHIWTGACTAACAVAFRDKRYFADLSGLARIRFDTRMSGFHHIRPIVKLAEGTWWVGDQTVGTDTDFLVSEISFADLRWLKLDTTHLVTHGDLVDKIDLSKVDEIGFVDLEAGSGHGKGGSADVAEIEVYARPIARTAGG